MRASGVEVTQQRRIPLLATRLSPLLCVVPLSFDVVGDDALDCGFGAAVCVGGANRAVLWDGDHVGEAGGIAIDGSGRGEDNVGHIVLGHGAEEGDAAANVHTVVFQGDLARLADSLAMLSNDGPTAGLAKWDIP